MGIGKQNYRTGFHDVKHVTHEIFLQVLMFNRASLAVSPKMEATQMEIFNFLWLTWDH